MNRGPIEGIPYEYAECEGCHTKQPVYPLAYPTCHINCTGCEKEIIYEKVSTYHRIVGDCSAFYLATYFMLALWKLYIII
jgi:hypothetical protein